MKIDHVAIVVEDPETAANWYATRFDAKILYSDPTWAFIEFENIKLAFVVKGQHPPHFAFKVSSEELSGGKLHRDGTVSVYKKDPWGNFYELIKYPKEEKDG